MKTYNMYNSFDELHKLWEKTVDPQYFSPDIGSYVWGTFLSPLRDRMLDVQISKCNKGFGGLGKGCTTTVLHCLETRRSTKQYLFEIDICWYFNYHLAYLLFILYVYLIDCWKEKQLVFIYGDLCLTVYTTDLPLLMGSTTENILCILQLTKKEKYKKINKVICTERILLLRLSWWMKDAHTHANVHTHHL